MEIQIPEAIIKETSAGLVNFHLHVRGLADDIVAGQPELDRRAVMREIRDRLLAEGAGRLVTPPPEVIE